MEDVAARVGVSRSLVSLVFRDAPGAGPRTRERVLRAAAEIGYRPDSAARVLARSRSRVLGVLLTVRNPFHADLVEAIYPEAERLGYDVVLSADAPTRSSHKAIETLLGHRCEAVILLGPTARPSFLTSVLRRAVVVSVGRRFPGTGVETVHTAEARGIRSAVDYLTALGHREIVHIDGGSNAGSPERRRDYRAAMRRNGLADEIRVLRGDHTEESGAVAAHQLLSEDRLPTAVLAGNDRCAMGFLDAVSRAGVVVPDDVSVVGFDDIPSAGLSHIALTTVRQDVPGLARAAVELAVHRLENSAEPGRESVLDPELVVRETTAAPRGTTATRPPRHEPDRLAPSVR
ncbi:LacI family DNA-binding transcriptional regulator [Halostreptopolyspora alba]|uniref:LacI family transcriptional regulator n=1 Tax=Halostreptopolyspora alba TaxID=2487137 RepID=A0A3N0E866_9ACTN|nr:LacI family transcriptional regulator [Nocardiopsaceae bacterium YIM 96095]